MPVSEPQGRYTLDLNIKSEEVLSNSIASVLEDEVFSLVSSSEPQLISQAELNNLVHDLHLFKTETQ